MNRQRLIIPMILTALLFACVAAGVMTYVPSNELMAGFRRIFSTFEGSVHTVLVVFALAAVVIALTLAAYFIWRAIMAAAMARYKVQTAAAEALKARREACLVITTAPPGHQVYAHELSPSSLPQPASRTFNLPGEGQITHKPLHLAPAPLNGHPIPPGPAETQRWALFNLAHLCPSNPLREPSTSLREPSTLSPISVELPNRVELADLLLGTPSLHRLALGIGRYPDGQVKPVTAPLARLVHIATAGSSGFGKSTFMQALAYQVINAREGATPVMLDAQGVTFGPFEDHPRLLHPLVSEEDDIQRALTGLVREMDRRKELFTQHRGVVNLAQYNALITQESRIYSDPQESRIYSGHDRLPEIPIFFDEFGLVADNKEIAGLVRRLAQGGRKFGLYLIAGSQTWLASDISTAIRANLSTSVQFAARDKAQSRVLIGDSIAANITQPGRAYAILPGQAGLIELQAPDPAGLVRQLAWPEEQPVTQPLPEAEPTEIESRILELAEAGASRARICETIWGYKSSNKYPEIEAVLARFSLDGAKGAKENDR